MNIKHSKQNNAEIFSFSVFNPNAKNGISSVLSKFNKTSKPPIILCVGSDLVLGDSLGPLIGTFLQKRNVPAHVYGTLSFPITAKEINYAKDYLKKTHPLSPVIAIDAAVGDLEDVGTIRVLNHGIKPGLGVNKNLKIIGDYSIIGIVTEKEHSKINLLNATRLNLIYKMAEQITAGVENFLLKENSSLNA